MNDDRPTWKAPIVIDLGSVVESAIGPLESSDTFFGDTSN